MSLKYTTIGITSVRILVSLKAIMTNVKGEWFDTRMLLMTRRLATYSFNLLIAWIVQGPTCFNISAALKGSKNKMSLDVQGRENK